MFTRVAQFIADNLDVDPGRITPDTNILTDLSVNSIDLINLVCELESEFKVEIPDRRIREFMVVGDIVAFLEAHADDRPPA